MAATPISTFLQQFPNTCKYILYSSLCICSLYYAFHLFDFMCFFPQPFFLPNASSSALFSTVTNHNSNANAKTSALRKTPEEINNTQILTTLAKSLWMKDNFEFRFRVLAALSFLVGAKVTMHFLLPLAFYITTTILFLFSF